MRVELHPEALAELRSAALWYDERRLGLADELLSEVFSVIDSIGESALRYPVWPGTASTPQPIRRALVRRFPYMIAFEAHLEHVLVLAVAHSKRRPLYWLSRAAGPASS